MLQFLVDTAVPACLSLLMLVAGTEVTRGDFQSLAENPRAVLLGSAGQLLVLPAIAFVIIAILSPPPAIAAGLLLLSLSPGGGISNSYCYLARCNVLLSATTTAVATALCLITIPAWLAFLPNVPSFNVALLDVPTATIFAQLLILMVLPMVFGMWVRCAYPEKVSKAQRPLRWLSIGVVAVILVAAMATVRGELSGFLLDIGFSATQFIVAAMMVGWLLGHGLGSRDRAVLVIEAGVRNVSVALLLGGTMLPSDAFGILASFITGYFIWEAIIMLAYARHTARRLEG